MKEPDICSVMDLGGFLFETCLAKVVIQLKPLIFEFVPGRRGNVIFISLGETGHD